MRRAGLLALLAAAGCGGDDERASTREPAGTQEATPTQTAPPAPERAGSVAECVEIWNADALAPESYQVSANEFFAELAPVRVHVAYQRGHCFVTAPIGGGRILFSSAQNGRRPFSNPERRRLKPGERVPYNGRADREGRVTLD